MSETRTRVGYAILVAALLAGCGGGGSGVMGPPDGGILEGASEGSDFTIAAKSRLDEIQATGKPGGPAR